MFFFAAFLSGKTEGLGPATSWQPDCFQTVSGANSHPEEGQISANHLHFRVYILTGSTYRYDYTRNIREKDTGT